MIHFTNSTPSDYVTGNGQRTYTLSTYDEENNYREWITVVATIVETTDAAGTISVDITFVATKHVRDEEDRNLIHKTDITTPNDSKVFTFTLANDYADVVSYYNPTSKVNYKFPAHLDTVTIFDETLVSYGAFINIDSLENVILNDTDSVQGTGITEIQDRAFYNTQKLRNVLVNRADGSFDFDGSLIELPTNLLTLGSDVFRYDTSVTGIIITPEFLSTIGNHAFADMIHATSAEIRGTVLGDYMFARNYCLERVDLVGDVVEIATGAFYNCISLAHFDDKDNPEYNYHFKASITTIDSYAFALNSNIHTLYLPKTIEKVEENAFAGSKNIQEFNLPFIGEQRYSEEREAIASVLGWLFGTEIYYKYTLPTEATNARAIYGDFVYTTQADMEAYLENYASRMIDLYGGTYAVTKENQEDGTLLYEVAFTNSLGIQAYTLSLSDDMAPVVQNHAESLGKTYQMPKQITSITVYDDTVIGYGAAMNLVTLTDLTLDPKIVKIDDYAFYNDYALEYIAVNGTEKQMGVAVLPTSIQEIGNYAFSLNTR